MAELEVRKTYKLYVGGEFVRTESGRYDPVPGAGGDLLANVSRGSRKDLREAVRKARAAQPGWAGKTAYLKGQILYRMAEMLEGRAESFEKLLRETPRPDGGRGAEGGPRVDRPSRLLRRLVRQVRGALRNRESGRVVVLRLFRAGADRRRRASSRRRPRTSWAS